MNQKSIEHIALYSLVLVGTLVVGVLARQFVLSKGIDDFSSSVAFFATVIVLMAIYASLQTTFNQFLLPRIEAFLLRFSAFQTMKNYNDTVSVPEAPTIKDSNQATTDIIESDPTAKETISEPSEYEVMRTNAIAKKNRATQTRLEKVLSYTKQTMVAYMSEEDLNRLCAYIVEYSSGDTLQKISPVKVDSQLKSIDIMHFGWNIGKAFGIRIVRTHPSPHTGRGRHLPELHGRSTDLFQPLLRRGRGVRRREAGVDQDADPHAVETRGRGPDTLGGGGAVERRKPLPYQDQERSRRRTFVRHLLRVRRHRLPTAAATEKGS